MPPLPSLAPLTMSVPAADGLVLRGTLSYPADPAAGPFPLAILAHQYPATRDSYAPLVADLLALGVATLAFDQRGHGESIQGPGGPVVIDTPRDFSDGAFVDAFVGSAGRVGFARIDDDIVRVAAWGASQNFVDASRLLLVGSSVGGSGVLLAGPRLGARLRGTITFGAAGAPAWGADAAERIRAITAAAGVPYLLATSEGDAFNGAGNVRHWGDGLAHVQQVLVPGDAHAMAIYFAVREAVLAFVRARCAA